MNPIKILITGITLTVLASLLTACSEDEVPGKLKATLLCDGDKGVIPFAVNCKYFFLDGSNKEIEPADTVYWTLDIALEGIPQRFYSQTTGNEFFTEIDRPGEYTLTAANEGNKSSILLSVSGSPDDPSALTRQVPVKMSSDKAGKQDRLFEASPGYEITKATIQLHPNSTRVSSRVVIPTDRSYAMLIVEFQPKKEAFNKVVRAWFAGNVVLTERKITDQ